MLYPWAQATSHQTEKDIIDKDITRNYNWCLCLKSVITIWLAVIVDAGCIDVHGFLTWSDCSNDAYSIADNFWACIHTSIHSLVIFYQAPLCGLWILDFASVLTSGNEWEERFSSELGVGKNHTLMCCLQLLCTKPFVFYLGLNWLWLNMKQASPSSLWHQSEHSFLGFFFLHSWKIGTFSYFSLHQRCT